MSADPQPPETNDSTSNNNDNNVTSTNNDTAAAAAAATPITPGPRATRLKDLYAQALGHTLSKLAYENMAACYPTIATRNRSVLEQIRAQMARKLDEKCRAEFENILASRAVVPKLNELEVLVAEASEEQQERARRRGDDGNEEEEDPIP